MRQIAKELGVSASYLSQVKHGKRPASHRVARVLSTHLHFGVLSNSALNVKQNFDNISLKTKRRGVAQPGSAPEWGSGGRRFKSGHPDHRYKIRWSDHLSHPKAKGG